MTGKILNAETQRNIFGLRREAERHAAFDGETFLRKAVSPLRSATAVQKHKTLRLCASAVKIPLT